MDDKNDSSTMHRRVRFHHRKPNWWPENEAWPPVQSPWRATRGRFFKRMGCAIALINLLAFFVFAGFLGLVLNSLGIIHIIYKPIGWLIPVGIVLMLFAFASLISGGRGLRRISAPLGDLLEAAGHITEGDYSQRVVERGPAELRALVRAFNDMAARLQLTEEQRRDLMADITHELRTPLTVIQGNLEGFLDGVYSPDEARLKSLLEETQILARLVEDLRTLALAESGALQLKKEPTELGLLLGETVSAFRSQADAAGIKLDIQSDTDGLVLSIDPERIRQVLSNLIANALRYTPRDGAIHVRVTTTRSDDRKFADIFVADTGVGIAPDILPQIFNRFYKSRDSSGTGLGLPIARHLVDAHGGSISAESQLGQGTTMHIRLPVED
jgi:signal transduction histidine kinase